jgi:hypothetical protein
MIALLDTSHDLALCSAEIGHAVGQLLTPRTLFARKSEVFAIDNGAYARFNRDSFFALLDREREIRKRCLWVTLPDVVGSARRTLELWDRYRYNEHLHGYRRALVLQDGIEDLPIPWDQVDAVFVGGTTEWKMSDHAAQCVRCAQAMGKATHAGRVNTPDRWRHFEALGVDTCDGSGISRYSHMRTAIASRGDSKQLSLGI